MRWLSRTVKCWVPLILAPLHRMSPLSVALATELILGCQLSSLGCLQLPLITRSTNFVGSASLLSRWFLPIIAEE
ncbi:orf p8 [Oat chlorotic stunt virus]|uniref:Uncharacterized protein p8 n=1 Tax=Oat chlorotic stunt virus (isolate United Kingdom) TaxID=652110 RepID=P8_OCSVU|nr:hypothetical protein [Oat chlorotic stunt virus]Q83929.1 RecName: Full=Uncharacterized protein p8 [Oat chlorotic stunt virus isolate United Kingdom]CAA58799.1 orf p8 [Oat chlorotic stunt virus]